MTVCSVVVGSSLGDKCDASGAGRGGIFIEATDQPCFYPARTAKRNVAGDLPAHRVDQPVDWAHEPGLARRVGRHLSIIDPFRSVMPLSGKVTATDEVRPGRSLTDC